MCVLGLGLLVGLVHLHFFRITPVLSASAKLNLCFQGFQGC